jgi:hypothetical protein
MLNRREMNGCLFSDRFPAIPPGSCALDNNNESDEEQERNADESKRTPLHEKRIVRYECGSAQNKSGGTLPHPMMQSRRIETQETDGKHGNVLRPGTHQTTRTTREDGWSKRNRGSRLRS